MPVLRPILLAASILSLSGLGAVSVARADIDPTAVSVVPFDKLEFHKAPNGAETAKVFGDSTKPEAYGIVIRWPPHVNTRPHSHPNARIITVLSGTWWVGTGAKYRPESMVPMKAGSFVTDLPNQIHYDGTKDDTAMIYITGMGPAPTIDREEK